ncbi:MAG: D-aminoacylase [Chloroflexi bacterium]|nr:D-aminoacylase [Chloroflexota bacterium]
MHRRANVFDTLIANGMVVDGTGRLRYEADLGISGGKIAAIGKLEDSEAARVIDATGLIVAPGFIDMHTHSDLSLLDDPGGESKAHQGVTTEVTGNCGESPFPVGPGPIRAMELAPGSTIVEDWTDLDGWANRMNSNGISINVAPQVGHSAVRKAVGLTEDRRPTEDELREMRRLVAESIEQGAFSFSTGLTVWPSMFGDTDEVAALAEAASGFENAFYVSHARLWAGNHVKAVEEAIEIGRRAGLPVQYSHMAIIDPRAYGTGQDMVGPIERARAQGLDVTYDMYPYTAAGSHLSQNVPTWLQAGGNDAMVQRLRDPEQRRRALEETKLGHFGGLPWKFDTIVISYLQTEENQGLIGKTVDEIAREREEDPHETYLWLIEVEENHVGAVVHNRVESDIRFFMSHPQAMIGSDGNAISPTGVSAGERPHPRYYGTYPRILGQYVREQSLISLETAVHKMAGLPADRLGLRDRGRVEEGLIADLAVFDPATVIDRATFEEPHQLAAGVPHVLVNGELIVHNGNHTGARPGRVLRRGA